jgi:hypothetical protein
MRDASRRTIGQRDTPADESSQLRRERDEDPEEVQARKEKAPTSGAI